MTPWIEGDNIKKKKKKIGFFCYTSQLEPKNVEEALGDES